ncbi:MAG: LPS export ABC transporter periplasmic protein LptC [Betaproteobacteria bacterium]
MSSRPLPLLPLSVLVLLVALTFWLSQVVDVVGNRPEEAKRHEPDLIIENFSAHKLNVAGDIEYSVNAEKMLHYQDDDSSVLERVLLAVTQTDQPKITATAPRGKLLRQPSGDDEISMEGGVQVNSEANEKYPPLKLVTPKLTVIPDQNLAKSTDGVVLDGPMGDLKSKAFVLNTLTRKILFDTVHMSYLPVKKP